MKSIPVLAFALFALCCVTVGCGGGGTTSTSCSPTALSVFPQTATVNHNSGSNAQQFGSTEIVPTGCTTPAATGVTWSSSDPNDAPVNTTGLVTCLHATTGAATIIATLPGVTQPGVSGTTSLTGSASITCN